ncbi:MAG: four helix bundle protein [Fimbriimonas sp.]|nr:four helix bundle protein [Fimbriimonas sp.]
MGVPLKSYRELRVWQRTMDLLKLIYEETRKLPSEERFGLTQQMRRAAVSVPSNIAEGYGRRYRKEYLKFLSDSYGSLYELETQVLACQMLGYGLQYEPVLHEIDQVSRQLSALQTGLNRIERNP